MRPDPEESIPAPKSSEETHRSPARAQMRPVRCRLQDQVQVTVRGNIFSRENATLTESMEFLLVYFLRGMD